MQTYNSIDVHCLLVSCIIPALHVDQNERDGCIGRTQGRQSAGDEGRCPGWGIREGVHPPLQRCAAEPERTPAPQHPDWYHPGCWQRTTTGALCCARGLQVGAKAKALTQNSPSAVLWRSFQVSSDVCLFEMNIFFTILCMFLYLLPAFHLRHPLYSSSDLSSTISDLSPLFKTLQLIQISLNTSIFPSLLAVGSSTRCTPTECCFRGAAAAGSSSGPCLSLTPWTHPASPCCLTSCTPPASLWHQSSCPGCSLLQHTCRWTTWPIPAGISCSCTGEGTSAVTPGQIATCNLACYSLCFIGFF